MLVLIGLLTACSTAAQECVSYDHFLQRGVRMAELDTAMDLAARGTVLYAADDGGVSVYLVSTGGRLQAMAGILDDLTVEEVRVFGARLCVLGQRDGIRSLHVLDITLPEAPLQIAAFPIPSSAKLHDCRGESVWLENRIQGSPVDTINEYRWSNVDELNHVRTLAVPDGKRFLAMRHPLVFLEQRHEEYSYPPLMIEVWDYSDPEQPQLTPGGNLFGGTEIYGVEVGEDFMLVHGFTDPGSSMLCSSAHVAAYRINADGSLETGPRKSHPGETSWGYLANDFLLYVSATDRTATVVAPDNSGGASFEVEGSVRSTAVAGGQWFLIDDLGVQRVDLCSPNAVSPLALYGSGGGTNIDFPFECNGLLVEDDRAYVAWTFGLAIVDVSAPESLRTLGEHFWGQPSFMSITGNWLYASDWESSSNNIPYLYTYDITDHESPLYEGALQLPHLTGRLLAMETAIYAAAGESGLMIFDRANPASPAISGEMYAGEMIRDVMAWGNQLLTAGRSVRIHRLDSPLLPLQVGEITLPAPAHHLERSGSLLFVSLGESGLQIWDLGTLDQPQLLGSLDQPSYECRIDGELGYLRSDEIAIVDISDSSEPRRVAGHRIGRRLEHLALAPNGLLAGLGNAPCRAHWGVELLPYHCAQPSPVLLSEFVLRPGKLRVEMSWEADVALGTEFRIAALDPAGRHYSLEAYSLGFGRYAAVDESSDLSYGGTFTYSLVARAPEDIWRRVASDQMEMPVRVSAILGTWPNPFNPTLTMSLSQTETGRATVAVYDVLGRMVRLLHDGPLPVGRSQMEWDGMSEAGTPAASGVFFIRYEAGKTEDSAKVVLLR